jgi:LacI family purine nucleotide synthesis repressor
MHGFFQGMYDAHLPVHPDWIFSSPDYDGCGVDRHILEQLLDKLQQPHAPTALIAPSPSLMLTAYRAADSLDIRIPRDLSIVGMDEIPHGEYVNVAPTTLRQPLEAIGKAAGEHLWASFSSKESDVKHLFKPTLIERESCQPLSTPS